MANLEDMDKFLGKYNLPKLNKEEIENLNRPIRNMKIRTVIKNLPTNKSPWPDDLIGKFYQKLKEEVHISCSISSRKLHRKENSQTHSMGSPLP